MEVVAAVERHRLDVAVAVEVHQDVVAAVEAEVIADLIILIETIVFDFLLLFRRPDLV